MNEFAPARLAVATMDAETVAALEDQVAAPVWIEQKIGALRDAGARGGEAEKYQAARRERRTAETALLRAQPRPGAGQGRSREAGGGTAGSGVSLW